LAGDGSGLTGEGGGLARGLSQTMGKLFPGQVAVVESLFRQGVRRAEAAAPGKKFIWSFF
jgi:hypothetical protein